MSKSRVSEGYFGMGRERKEMSKSRVSEGYSENEEEGRGVAFASLPRGSGGKKGRTGKRHPTGPTPKTNVFAGE